MAKKQVTRFIKLQIPAGKANPAPPVGPALGAAQVNIMQFCQQFNAATQDQAGTIIPVEITVYEDKTFTFVCKTPPAAVLIKEKLGIQSRLASSPRSSSPRSPRSRCRTSTPTIWMLPRRSSLAPLVRWASPSPSSTSVFSPERGEICGRAHARYDHDYHKEVGNA